MQSSTLHFLLFFLSLSFDVFFRRLFAYFLKIKIEWFFKQATKVKVFSDMLSSHSSANSRMDKTKEKKRRTIKFQICTKHTVYPACAEHFKRSHLSSDEFKCQKTHFSLFLFFPKKFKFIEILTCLSCATQCLIQR